MARPPFHLLFLACFSLASCRRDGIQTYEIPKETGPSGMAVPAGMDMAPAASSKDIEWQVPEGWEEQAPSSVRLGSFLAKGPSGGKADISIVPLSGEAGGNLSNINRWRGQISLPPITEEELARQSEAITPAGRKMILVNMTNQGKRLIAAIYRQNQRTWFFKMMGDDAAVQAAEPAFRQFLKSIKFHGH